MLKIQFACRNLYPQICIGNRAGKPKIQERMNRFFNIIPGKDACCILLYGEIGEYGEVRAGDIARELMEAEAAYEKIDVRINSIGGDVYTGIAIFNALRNSSADIRIYVDGVAASMASVIALCGKPVQMSRYARLMIHGISGGFYGNKGDLQECLREIESLEGTLCQMYAQKTGRTAEEIKAAYFDGKEHWLRAEEALSLGFVDGIYDAEPVPEDSTPEQVYQLFNNRLERQPQNTNCMDFNLDEAKKRPSFRDCTNESDILRVMDRLEGEAGQIPALNAENEALKKRIKSYEDKERAETEAAKKKLLDDAEADGRINAETRPVYENLLDSDRENGEKALMALKPKRRVSNDIRIEREATTQWEKRIKEIKDKLNR